MSELGSWCTSSVFLGKNGKCRNPDGCTCDEIERLRSSLSTARSEGIREGLDETWLAEMIYSEALGCDPTSKTIKANREPYGTWKKAVDAAAAIRAKIEEVKP